MIKVHALGRERLTAVHTRSCGLDSIQKLVMFFEFARSVLSGPLTPLGEAFLAAVCNYQSVSFSRMLLIAAASLSAGLVAGALRIPEVSGLATTPED